MFRATMPVVSFSWPQQAISIRRFPPQPSSLQDHKTDSLQDVHEWRSFNPCRSTSTSPLPPRNVSGLRSPFRGSVLRPCPASPSSRGPNASTFAAATFSVVLASSMPAVLSAGTCVVLIARSASPSSRAPVSASVSRPRPQAHRARGPRKRQVYLPMLTTPLPVLPGLLHVD